MADLRLPRASSVPPRAVIVHRATEYEGLLARHATRGQAAFFLHGRGQDIDELEARHAAIQSALTAVMAAVPTPWRHTRVERSDLNRFNFEPSDVVLTVGQDGLVANVAKYLAGQPVIGVNPMAAVFDGILVQHAPASVAALLAHLDADHAVPGERRTMVQGTLDDGQHLLALNELFVGHRSHQSARYMLRAGASEERHSSSGVIVATGTGATGWARSINRSRAHRLDLPEPEDAGLAWFVREAFPNVATGTSLDGGRASADEPLHLRSEMDAGGVIFGDGMETDHLDFGWGQQVQIDVAKTQLHLVTA
ncbi:MAG: hypothetical protein AB8G96_07600 [Phycisphaerales bacterium]